jgi:hypothetical protein
MIIKKLILKYECLSCGTIINIERIIYVDEFLKKIDIVKPTRCSCGRNFLYKLLELNLIDFNDERN